MPRLLLASVRSILHHSFLPSRAIVAAVLRNSRMPSMAFLSPTWPIRLSPSTSLHCQRLHAFHPCTRPLQQQRRAQAVNCTASSPTQSTTSSASEELPVGKPMTSLQIRESFLSFFESKQHDRHASASLVPNDPTILLNIAGMVPFKPIFLGTEPPPPNPRATSSQKCIRTNDIENVGVTKRHHTFFEMLGNFSFGDYFKKDAIRWAWQLLTEVYAIPPQRLAVSVFESDDDAFNIWRDEIGIPPHRIQRLGAEDNFWASGPTGPCGPCSEIYFDFNPTSDAPIDLEDDNRFIELYNLVFMQFSRDSNGQLSPLAAQNIDTGMGLERMAQVLQQVPTNYETDLILPIIESVAYIASVPFAKASPAQKISLKVVGDHMRAIAHLIGDGVRPSNIGRGYIVRRLIRRIVRHGRLLGIDGPFTRDVLPVVSALAQEAGLGAVAENLDDIMTEVEREEIRFLQTLENGEDRLADLVERLQSSGRTVIPGEEAFELYDTFGFPLELTEEVAAEHDFVVDVEAFNTSMAQQRERARAARDSSAFDVDGAALLGEAVEAVGSTKFTGHSSTATEKCTVAAIIARGAMVDVAFEGDAVRVMLDTTPFYAEGGGQVGDIGMLSGSGGSIKVTDTQKDAGAYVHVGEVTTGEISVGDVVRAEVTATTRRRIMAHHTATHLLQAALKKVIPDGGIAQAGSLVDGDRLRFDFSCGRAVTDEEVESIERLVNQWIGEARDTEVTLMSLEKAKEVGAVAMFGEKYDANEVRVVDVPGVSMELCGGTHVENTAEIGLFKVASESGPSSGVRRLEAVCGAAVLPYLQVRDKAVRELSGALKARPEELVERVAGLQEELKARGKELDKALSELAVAKARSLQGRSQNVGEFCVIVQELEGEVSADGLKAATENLGNELGENAVVVLGSKHGGKVSFVAYAGKGAQKKGVQAGKLVAQIAKLCGGGGGGRPNFAQAGGKDVTKFRDALDLATNEAVKKLS